ncbi:MAG: hypothetical protein NTW19_06570 [Planctomycetota bacterium]|nr:hypothetical protein [Planctomycetota bacterium]
MSDKAPTGEMKFSGEGTGLFIAHEDLDIYLSSLQAMRAGRGDPISAAAVSQLIDLMTQAADDQIGRDVQVCKSFDDCRITTATLDSLMRT